MENCRIAYFVSPHGFGHAARASAVLSALQERLSGLRTHLFTTIPEWFFEASRIGDFCHHPFPVDIGMVQKNALHEDLAETVHRLDAFLPFSNRAVEEIAKIVVKSRCEIVVCDIAPLGVAVAEHAGILSVLVENFTWDWIYAYYLEKEPRLERHVAYLTQVFGRADHHIQTDPVCAPQRADLRARPASRPARASRESTREMLGSLDGRKLVLITMGGLSREYAFLEQLSKHQQAVFVIPGAEKEWVRRGNAVLLPTHSPFFHPDLVHAADAVIGKAGYSTIAEVYQAGVPFGFVSRPDFREAQALSDFIREKIRSREIAEQDFQSGRWLSSLDDILAMPRAEGPRTNGAGQIADYICRLLQHSH